MNPVRLIQKLAAGAAAGLLALGIVAGTAAAASAAEFDTMNSNGVVANDGNSSEVLTTSSNSAEVV